MCKGVKKIIKFKYFNFGVYIKKIEMLFED